MHILYHQLWDYWHVSSTQFLPAPAVRLWTGDVISLPLSLYENKDMKNSLLERFGGVGHDLSTLEAGLRAGPVDLRLAWITEGNLSLNKRPKGTVSTSRVFEMKHFNCTWYI